jgi:hypothetical protein
MSFGSGNTIFKQKRADPFQVSPLHLLLLLVQISRPSYAHDALRKRTPCHFNEWNEEKSFVEVKGFLSR